jgi:hypothetical protein
MDDQSDRNLDDNPYGAPTRFAPRPRRSHGRPSAMSRLFPAIFATWTLLCLIWASLDAGALYYAPIGSGILAVAGFVATAFGIPLGREKAAAQFGLIAVSAIVSSVVLFAALILQFLMFRDC